jgi:hypothetical protein
MKSSHRIVAVIWDSQFLCVQRAVYLVAGRLAVHLDELARRRDEDAGRVRAWSCTRGEATAPGDPVGNA